MVRSSTIKAVRCLFKSAKSKEPCIIRKKSAPAHILDDSWLAARKVADGSVADPHGLEVYVSGLCPAELSTGVLNALLIVQWCRCEFLGIIYMPPIFPQQQHVISVCRPGAEKQRKSFRGGVQKLENSEKAVCLSL